MENEWNGPWSLKSLIDNPNNPLPKKVGNYVISIPQTIYNPHLHGPSRFICIGGMKTSKNSSLAKRLGEFIAAAFGFKTRHSEGWTFYDNHEQYRLTAWDLEIWWLVNDDPQCGEVALFKSYKKKFGTLPLVNKQEKWTGCNLSHNIDFKCPWD